MSPEGRVLQRLFNLIVDERQKSVDAILTGKCADHSMYRYSCGYIKSLDDMLALREQAETEIKKEDSE